MRKHGWQLPHHPLQVVAVSIFLALGIAFYVFFSPFVGRKQFQYIVIGLYSPLIICVFSLYIWCAAADPADSGVFKSRKYLNMVDSEKHTQLEASNLGGKSTLLKDNMNAAKFQQQLVDQVDEIEKKNACSCLPCCGTILFSMCPRVMTCLRTPEHSSEQQISEGGMFYCTLCEVEVFKYSKHCRVCDKCIDSFDHHCRWLNNCIGKKNYTQFFILMVSALLLLTLQWSIGILVIVCCFLERKQLSVKITSQLGSGFSFMVFVTIVASCTILAMLATFPLGQLLSFHILLAAKGISTYDYIVALREEEQQGLQGRQVAKMSPASSMTGFSSASSGSTFRQDAWCTPPQLFFEDKFNPSPPEASMSISSLGKRMSGAEGTNKKKPSAVKISPWMLARMDAEEASKVSARARMKSKILQPVGRQQIPLGLETGSSSGQMILKPDNRMRSNKRIHLPLDIPLKSQAKISGRVFYSDANDLSGEISSACTLQVEARKGFLMSQTMSASPDVATYSPDSGQDSPHLHAFRVSSSGPEETRELAALHEAGFDTEKGISLSRSVSNGYEPSGSEDSDQVSSRTVQRSTNWSNLLLPSVHHKRLVEFKAFSSLK